MAFAGLEIPPELERILLVEGQSLARVGLAEFLRVRGYRVFDAGESLEALQILQSGQALDLAIVDASLLGGADGFDLARALRAECPDIKVIVTSDAVHSIGQPEDGLSDVRPLLKPFSRRDLLDSVREALAAQMTRAPSGDAG